MAEITQHRAAAPEAFGALFESVFDPAVVIDPVAGRFVAANPAAETLFGYTAAELRAMSPADIHPHEIPRLDRFLGEVRAHGGWTADDLSCRLRDGREIPAVIRARLVTHDGRERILAVIRDRREKRLSELGAAVRQLMHDLKNALATAQLMSDRLAQHDDRRVRLTGESLARALDRAVALCRETLEVGRARARPPERERFLLADVVEEVEASVIGLEATGAVLADESAAAVPLDADFDQVFRILLNLVRNAVDAGAMRVATRGEGDVAGATLMVCDDGPGLPQAVIDRLGRAQPETAAGGSGLGLMIAAALARGHGGALEVAESGPSGTCFRVTLPAAQPER
jgi:PAS domain S-box-containing protein